MSGRLAQYKKAGRIVQSKKASVREEKIRETKSKRNDRFMSGRPLCDEVDIQSKKLDKEKIKSKTVCTRRMDTKEELLKWKEKRQTQIAKEKAIKKQRPPFVVGKFKLGEDKLELQTIEKH